MEFIAPTIITDSQLFSLIIGSETLRTFQLSIARDGGRVSTFAPEITLFNGGTATFPTINDVARAVEGAIVHIKFTTCQKFRYTKNNGVWSLSVRPI